MARELKQQAESDGFAMVAYLLELAALEAEDCEKSIASCQQDSNNTVA